LSNVSIKDFREFLSKAGCNCQGIESGHEKWTRPDLLRPVVFQTHIDPIPEFIIRANLRTLKLGREDFFNILFDVYNKKT
jgi:hypothetical protein